MGYSHPRQSPRVHTRRKLKAPAAGQLSHSRPLVRKEIKMTIQIETYLKSLASEYLELCRLMKSGQFDGDEYRELSSQRALIHDELIRVLGDDYARPFDMKSHCRALLASD